MQVTKLLLIGGAASAVLAIGIAAAIYLPKMAITPDNKFKVLMAGRSTTDILFRHWNIPETVNKISIWKEWPIPRTRYQKDDVFFEYAAIAEPHRGVKKKGYPYGQEMVRDIEKKLESSDVKYDAMMFKFCFVDFGDSNVNSDEQANKKMEDMKSIIKNVHGIAQKNKMKLLLGNSLPVLEPGVYAQKVRTGLNAWLVEYQKQQPDVQVVDLFGQLANEEGKLRPEFSLDLSDKDNHPSMEAYKGVEEELFKKVNITRGKSG